MRQPPFPAPQISISDFTRNPAAALRNAKSQLVAVLNHSKVAFYAVKPTLFDALLKELLDQELSRNVLARMMERPRAIEVDIDAI